jgi:hypothetical protein
MGGLYDILEAQRLQQPRFIYEGLYQDPDRFLDYDNTRGKGFTNDSDYPFTGNIPTNKRARADARAFNRGEPLPLPYGLKGGTFFEDFNPRVGTILPFQPYENPTFLAKQNVNPYLGIMSQAPKSLGFDTSFGVANEPDDEDDINKIKETQTGIAKLFEFLQRLPTPMNLLRGGLESLSGFNQRLRNTDFGQSRTGAEYAMRRRERKQAERAQEAAPGVYRRAREKGFTNQRGGFSTSRADRGGTSAGSGQFSSRRSTGRQGY